MAAALMQEEHEIFRRSVRAFIAAEIAPFHAKWEKEGVVDRALWEKAGKAGILCAAIPEEYGGGGSDFLTSVIINEELAQGVFSGPGFRLHSDIAAFYILRYGSEDQKRNWLPRMARGEAIAALAMTEPSAGSDLQNIRTSAVRQGDEYVINGQKTFITNGRLADFVILAVKTNPQAKAKGISLLLVEGDRKGFTRGKAFEKLGAKAQDTCELFFEDVRVPAHNLLGEEGKGFSYLMQELPQERLLVAIYAMAIAEAALRWTVEYAKQRSIFGGRLIDLQDVRFKLAEMKAQVTMTRVFLDSCVERHLRGELDIQTAAMCKWWTTEFEGRLLDGCLQLHGGNGFMWEYPIARAYADARIHRIFGGSSEIMKELIARSL